MMHHPHDETAISRLVHDWAAAVRRKDLQGILDCHAEDILMFDVPPPLQSRGLDAYRRTWDLFFSWSRDPVIFDIDDMHITAGDEVAFVTVLMRCGGRDRDRADADLDFRLTIGLRKLEGRWIITHEHHSVPASDALDSQESTHGDASGRQDRNRMR